MDENKEIEPLERMQVIVMDWLAKEDWSMDQLADWLQGYDLPLFGDSDEPYLWLLRGLPEGDERHATEKRFAIRVATLVNERPDVERPGKRPDQILYNLFMLCAGLSCADELADPLFKVLQRGRLKGNWHGIDLRTSLKAALIANQKDPRLWPIWEEALLDGESRFLSIDEYDFIEAARLMPPAADRRGTPAMDAIGKALKVAANRQEHHGRREEVFATLAMRIIDTYPSRPMWGRDLLIQALRQEWPRWAVEIIPADYPEYVSKIIQSVRKSPYTTERSVMGVIVHGLAESALWEKKSKTRSIQEAHEIGLKSLAVGAGAP